jgi:hypothetical protein
MHPLFQTRHLTSGRPAPALRWLSALLVLFGWVSRVDEFEDTADAFYIGVGDQFDDDRRRVHARR